MGTDTYEIACVRYLSPYVALQVMHKVDAKKENSRTQMFYHCEVIAGHALTIILFSNWIQYQKESEIILFQQPKNF